MWPPRRLCEHGGTGCSWTGHWSHHCYSHLHHHTVGWVSKLVVDQVMTWPRPDLLISDQATLMCSEVLQSNDIFPLGFSTGPSTHSYSFYSICTHRRPSTGPGSVRTISLLCSHRGIRSHSVTQCGLVFQMLGANQKSADSSPGGLWLGGGSMPQLQGAGRLWLMAKQLHRSSTKISETLTNRVTCVAFIQYWLK